MAFASVDRAASSLLCLCSLVSMTRSDPSRFRLRFQRSLRMTCQGMHFGMRSASDRAVGVAAYTPTRSGGTTEWRWMITQSLRIEAFMLDGASLYAFTTATRVFCTCQSRFCQTGAAGL